MSAHLPSISKEAMKQLRALGGVPESPTTASGASIKEKKPATKASVTDCCICESDGALGRSSRSRTYASIGLFSVTVQQALFIAYVSGTC